MNIRQIALVASNLEATQGGLFKLLGLERGFHDPAVSQFGLHNVVMRLGDTYLEVVAPVEEGTTAGRFLARRGGDSGYMVIVQVEDIAREQARVVDCGIRIAWEVHTDAASGVHLHPRDVPGAIASLDQMRPPEKWFWAGEEGGEDLPRATNVSNIVGAQIDSEDPAATADCWSRAYGLPVSGSPQAPVLAFESTVMRFGRSKDASVSALTEIDLLVRDERAIKDAAVSLGLPFEDRSVSYCGTRFNFVPAP